jgi:MFS family permease
LPRVLDRFRDRVVMLTAGAFLAAVLIVFAMVLWEPSPSVHWPALLVASTLLGIGYSSILTPSGRLLRRSAHDADRPAVFAAQFALSHACWLITYPLAGWLGATFGMTTTLAALSAITVLGMLLAVSVWPAADTDVLEHEHPNLDLGHAHLRAHPGHRHAHAIVIDDLHRRWPAPQA